MEAVGHRNIVCQDCHHLGMIEQNRLLVKFVFTTDRKTPEPHGNETPWKTCTKCHWDEAAQGSLTVNKSTGHARHVFMEKLACKNCHSRTVHSFRPDTSPVFAVTRIGNSRGGNGGHLLSPVPCLFPEETAGFHPRSCVVLDLPPEIVKNDLSGPCADGPAELLRVPQTPCQDQAERRRLPALPYS